MSIMSLIVCFSDSVLCSSDYSGSGDRVFSKANPGVVYVVPTRYETKAAFKIGHTSRHMRLKHGIVKKRKVRSDKGKKKLGPRAEGVSVICRQIC